MFQIKGIWLEIRMSQANIEFKIPILLNIIHADQVFLHVYTLSYNSYLNEDIWQKPLHKTTDNVV